MNPILKLCVLGILASACCLFGCASQSAEESAASQRPAEKAPSQQQATMETNNAQHDEESDMENGTARANATVVMNETSFAIELADNGTATAFAQMLPLQVEMSELHGNEKYVYLDKALPSHAANPGTIEAGDVMLYGDNCLVVFYETHATSYTYTRIGRISDVEGLRQAVGTGSIDATFTAN